MTSERNDDPGTVAKGAYVMNGLQLGNPGPLITWLRLGLRSTLCLAVLGSLLPVLPCGAQRNSTSPANQPFGDQIPQHRTRKPSLDPGQQFPSSEDDRIAAMRMSQLMAARQKVIVADTDKLLKLAKELNAEIPGAGSSAPTEAELRKVAQIQKLAHSIKKEMSIPVGVSLQRLNPTPPAPTPLWSR